MYFVACDHQLGLMMPQVHELLWLEDENLWDVVIIDPVAYFVKPATQIIRKHTSTLDDPTVHFYPLEEHKACYEDMFEQFHHMVDCGVVAKSLLHRLLELGGCESSGRIGNVVKLMVKFGLLVPRADVARCIEGDPLVSAMPWTADDYLVPALLPKANDFLLGTLRTAIVDNKL